MGSELKPCHCGSPATLKREHGHSHSRSWIECTKCPMRTAERGWLGDDTSIVDALTAAWNTRPKQAGVTEALQAARDEGFSDGVILALQVMTGAGDMGSASYEELLKCADGVKVYARAKSEGLLELSGLSDYIVQGDHQPSVEFAAAVQAAIDTEGDGTPPDPQEGR